MLLTPPDGPMRVVIMDFGLARVHEGFVASAAAGGGPETDFTQAGVLLGTPGYISPEQIEGESARPASDIYAFGVLAYEMLSGRKMATAGALTPGQTGLPANWEGMVMRCLSRTPEARPASALQALAVVNEDALAITALKERKAAGAKRYILAAAILLAAGLIYVVPSFREKVATALPGISTGGMNEEVLRAQELLNREYKIGNVSRAIVVLEDLARRKPEAALTHASLADAYFRYYSDTNETEYREKSKAAANRAVDLDADLAKPHVTLGSIYLDADKKDLAASELSTATRLDARNPEAYFAMAQLYRQQNRSHDMDEAIQKAIDLAPDDWRYRNWLGAHYRDLGKHQEAIAQYLAAAKLDPENPVTQNHLGTAYFKQNRLDEARQAFERSLQIEERGRPLANLGAIYHLQGQYQKAVENYRRALKLSAGSYLTWANLASALDQTPGGKAEARTSYLKAIEMAEARSLETPNDQGLLANLASYHAAVGNRDRSITLIRRSIALGKDKPDVARRAAETYEILQNRPEALRWVENALKLGYSLSDIRSNPDLAALRADPRFSKIEVRYQQKER